MSRSADSRVRIDCIEGNSPMIDLGLMPLVNNLHETAAGAVAAKRYPLHVVMDGDLTAHLNYQVPPAEMYDSYFYRSGVSAPFVQHCKEMFAEVAQLAPKRIIDIGGNDGTLLRAFQSQSTAKLQLVNVDASTSVRHENESTGIEFHNALWGDVSVGTADVIVSTNVFQHTADVEKFLAGIQRHLDGVWILEFPYFLTTLETNQFDQIYHEHYFYWLVTPLVELFRKYGLTIIGIRELAMHGGSLRIISTNKSVDDPRVWQPFVEREANYDYANSAARVAKQIEEGRAFFAALPPTTTVAAFGAAAKGVVYLNALGCHERFQYVVDDTPQKQGKFIPGTALEVVARERLLADQPDLLVILAHNFKDHITASLRPHYRGSIVTMIPMIHKLGFAS